MSHEDMVARILQETSEYTVVDLNAMSENELIGVYYDVVGMEGNETIQYDEEVDW
ncbi:hypothetical protein M2475_000998 [Breznakia sp. PF5-3]|uniref:hypothetical protein n=1 Tax=unclassified Breznakia TaxID=2623764 RepID=UPI002405F1D8|nr:MULTISPECIES: hypothetical protein [unclassified Breznakia]MDF9825761.1 hypothetical protein [Breznakia sp. PM6-1]MDF9835433.1 hypothetical protein [Breznakia sp. PF5-3]MDF9837665.1 hypothetical protein [Breznakia sp. PFB2-8]MDF9859529.1 hypothetical protein [Breznakia sp. PH5-24]